MAKIDRRGMRESSSLTKRQKNLMVPFSDSVRDAVRYNYILVKTMDREEILEMFYEILHTCWAEKKILTIPDTALKIPLLLRGFVNADFLTLVSGGFFRHAFKFKVVVSGFRYTFEERIPRMAVSGN